MAALDKAIGYIKRMMVELKYKNNRRRTDWWLFGEWFGQRNGDNSLFLANYVCENYPDITVYWVSRENTNVEKLSNSIHILKYDALETFELFKRVGAVFMNQGYIDFSSSGYNYFRGAITVNLWHGVAWKKIGHDSSKKRGFAHLINTYLVDYFDGSKRYLSTSNNYSSVLKTAFHAKDKQIIKAGYPRNSLFYSKEWLTGNRKKILTILKDRTNAVISDKTKIVVYMPTFRDRTREGVSLECLLSYQDFANWLEDSDVVIIQKAHFVNQNANGEPASNSSSSSNRIINLNNIESYEALGCADILITDYSSCFFDYLILNRPIIHFIYDYDSYRNEDRGVYYEKDDVICGDAPQSISSLIDSIKKYTYNAAADNSLRTKRKHEFMEYETYNSCELIVNCILQSMV